MKQHRSTWNIERSLTQTSALRMVLLLRPHIQPAAGLFQVETTFLLFLRPPKMPTMEWWLSLLGRNDLWQESPNTTISMQCDGLLMFAHHSCASSLAVVHSFQEKYSSTGTKCEIQHGTPEKLAISCSKRLPVGCPILLIHPSLCTWTGWRRESPGLSPEEPTCMSGGPPLKNKSQFGSSPKSIPNSGHPELSENSFKSIP